MGNFDYTVLVNYCLKKISYNEATEFSLFNSWYSLRLLDEISVIFFVFISVGSLAALGGLDHTSSDCDTIRNKCHWFGCQWIEAINRIS